MLKCALYFPLTALAVRCVKSEIMAEEQSRNIDRKKITEDLYRQHIRTILTWRWRGTNKRGSLEDHTKVFLIKEAHF